MLKYMPHTLGLLNLAILGFSAFVAIQGTISLKPAQASENAFREVTVDKTRLTSSAFAVFAFSLAQLAALYYYHRYGFQDMEFRGGYFILSIVNIILGSILLTEAIELHQIDGMTFSGVDDTGTTTTPALNNANYLLIISIVLGVVIILTNIANLYHAKTGTHTYMTRSKSKTK